MLKTGNGIHTTGGKEGAKWIIENWPHHEGLIRGSVHHRGYLIGRVNMVDCVSSLESPWFVGPWGFVFQNAYEFHREMIIPCRGMLGIFETKGR